MTVLLLCLESEVGGVLVGCIVPQSELNSTAVDTGAQAVGVGVALEPCNAAEKLTVDGRGTLRVAVGFVEEDGTSRGAPVSHLFPEKMGEYRVRNVEHGMYWHLQ